MPIPAPGYNPNTGSMRPVFRDTSQYGVVPNYVRTPTPEAPAPEPEDPIAAGLEAIWRKAQAAKREAIEERRCFGGIGTVAGFSTVEKLNTLFAEIDAMGAALDHPAPPLQPISTGQLLSLIDLMPTIEAAQARLRQTRRSLTIQATYRRLDAEREQGR